MAVKLLVAAFLAAAALMPARPFAADPQKRSAPVTTGDLAPDFTLADQNGRGAIAFPLLSDPQHRVIDAYGLADPRYLTQNREGIPYPAAYVVDRSGRVAWSRIDTDFRKRPPTREVRSVLDALK